MNDRRFVTCACFALLVSPWIAEAAGPSKVVVVTKDGEHRLLRGGEPYFIKGVGGDSYLAELSAAGGNSIRTWSTDNLQSLLDDAQRHNLTVCVGFWLGHQRHGFDYQDDVSVVKQLEAYFVLGAIEGDAKYRDSAKGELKSARLTTTWQRLRIPLEGRDLSRIKTGFGWSLAGQGKPVTFYLDDIRYITP